MFKNFVISGKAVLFSVTYISLPVLIKMLFLSINVLYVGIRMSGNTKYASVAHWLKYINFSFFSIELEYIETKKMGTMEFHL